MSFNKIILVGNLGKDPELRYTPQGTPVSKFTLATNERRKNKAGETIEHTEWFEVNVFGRQAESVSQYLTKGKPVYVEGRLSKDEWTDREGKQRTTLKVLASDVHFIGTGNGNGNGNGNAMAATAAVGASAEPASVAGEPEMSDDDIPF